MNATSELGTGKIGKLLFSLAVPAIAAQLINALYNIVDRMYIGHIPGVGATALTGVGVTFPIIMVIAAFAALIGMGGAPRAAIKMGEDDYDGAEKILGNCFISLIGISVVLTLFFLIFQEKILLMFGASENTIEYALDYMGIYVSGTIFVQFALGLNSFITTQGFAKTSMFTVLIGAILNIVLDPIFIFVFDMGVRGAAIATIISQAVSSIWVLCFLFGNKTKLKIKRKNFKLDPKVILPVIALGLAPFVMQSTESLVNITLNTSLQKFGGDVAVGSMTIISSIMMITFMPLSGLTQGAQPIIGFNYGARKMDRVKKTFKLLLASSMFFSALMWLGIMIIPNVFASIFTSNPELIKETVWAMRVFFCGILVLGAQTACQQTFVAVGQAKVSLLLALLRKVILLVPLAIILPYFLTNKVLAVFLAEPIADIGATSITVITFWIKSKKLFAPPALNEACESKRRV
ncbi:MAG: MATE family efflux transporter [Oscillospiraceae bacterium]